MSDYTKLTDYASKDALPSGNLSKLIKGTEIDADFLSIQTNMATKIDDTTASSPTVTTTLADADQLRMWNNAASAERQITAANAGLYFGTRPQYTGYAALSGNSVTSPAIPSTARVIVLQFNQAAQNAATNWRIRVADSGGTITSGYLSADGRIASGGGGDVLNSTSGFDIYATVANRTLLGTMTFTLMDSSSKLWLATWEFYDSVAAHKVNHGAGSVTLSAASAIQNIVISTVVGTATLSGNYNIMYY